MEEEKIMMMMVLLITKKMVMNVNVVGISKPYISEY